MKEGSMNAEQKKLIVKTALLVSALGESTKPDEFTPASVVYLSLNSDINEYNDIVRIGTRLGWVEATSETVRLTATGRAKARQLKAAGV